MRPQGTDFAASARSRESVLSLGSIAHLQYYFARTGLLDGKGAQLARKRQLKGTRRTLDLSALDTNSFLSPRVASGSDHDSSYASAGAYMLESPIEEHLSEQEFEYLSDDLDQPDPDMPPPTQSTYHHREKPLPRPPSIAELKAILTGALDTAANALKEARGNDLQSPPITPQKPSASEPSPDSSTSSAPAWHQIQGLHILDVMTLAIRAAKVYYTAHENPDRLDAIKSEKALRSELFSVMDVLKRMATRGFVGGMSDDESRTMEDWIAGLRTLLVTEETIEAAERAERASWAWLAAEKWAGRPEHEREETFLRSMLAEAPDPVAGMGPLPAWTPIDRAKLAAGGSAAAALLLPTPFLAALANGLRLVQLHNCAVRKSRRRFGAIPSFHTDTQKPYRAADNLRYWMKAAELRWEVVLTRVDPLALQYNNGGAEPWLDFEAAILQWCRKVREEITSEVQG